MSAVKFTFGLNLPFYLALPDSLFTCRRGGHTWGVSTVARFENVGGPAEGENAGVVEVDRSGKLTRAVGFDIPGAMLRYTDVSIMFEREVAGAPPVSHDETRKSQELAWEALNEFLDVYRARAEDPRVRRLSRAEFQDVRAGRALFVGTNMSTQTAGQFSFGAMFPEAPNVPAAPKLLDEPIVPSIRGLLERGERPFLSVILLLNARNHIYSAVIESPGSKGSFGA